MLPTCKATVSVRRQQGWSGLSFHKVASYGPRDLFSVDELPQRQAHRNGTTHLGKVKVRYGTGTGTAGSIRRLRKKQTLLTTKYFRDHHHRKFMSEILLLLVRMHSSFHHFCLYLFVLFPQMARLWKSFISASTLAIACLCKTHPPVSQGLPNIGDNCLKTVGASHGRSFFPGTSVR